MKHIAGFLLLQLFFATGCGSAGLSEVAAGTGRPPNVVIIFVDDMGYADIEPFGGSTPTPNLSRMAASGVRLTNFYVSSPVCSASRAALLTGCYNTRVSIQGALGPKSNIGISGRETTIAEMLKPYGYATAIFGKWHLGHRPAFLPTRHGFDEYFGLPYSNDMWPRHPEAPKDYPDLPLISGTKTVALNPDQSQLTTWYTEHAVDFIQKNADRPFFLYVPHNMPHVPLFVSDKFKGKSGRGLYSDVVMELDWSVGQILDTLDRLKLRDNTLVIFSSDNGPWLSYGNHAGSADGFREGKGTCYEGGIRVPFIASFPGRIPAGTTCAQPAATIDILPTIAAMTNSSLPQGRVLDGRDITPLLARPATAGPAHEVLYFYWINELHALRAGPWKLHLPHPYRSLPGREEGRDGVPAKYVELKTGLALFNLDRDPGEMVNVAKEHPEVVARLRGLAEEAREDLGDSLTNRKGRGIRPAGKL